jgi:sigma-B regulation protein RsbU (phosphoserine phosphatase)
MRVLVADDDVVSAHGLHGLMRSWGYEVVSAIDGPGALAVLEGDNAPQLALLDWVMPGLQGPDICRAVRGWHSGDSPYLILLTSRSSQTDIIAGLDAGADDYLVKPFDPGELRARLHAGARIVGLQRGLAEKVTELETALSKVRRLSGLLPICAYCKAIRDDSDYWHRVEEYVSEHADVQFSHGICPACLEGAMKAARSVRRDRR